MGQQGEGQGQAEGQGQQGQQGQGAPPRAEAHLRAAISELQPAIAAARLHVKELGSVTGQGGGKAGGGAGGGGGGASAAQHADDLADLYVDLQLLLLECAEGLCEVYRAGGDQRLPDAEALVEGVAKQLMV